MGCSTSVLGNASSPPLSKVVPSPDVGADLEEQASTLGQRPLNEPENEPGAGDGSPTKRSKPSLKDTPRSQDSGHKSYSSFNSSPNSSPGGSKGWNRSDKKLGRIRRQKDSLINNQNDYKKVSVGPTDISAEHKHFLNKVLQKHFLFEGLEDSDRNTIIPYMRQQKYNAGQVVFSQGQKGDSCYIIADGVFTVSIGGDVVKPLRPKHTFGELAMLYNVNRTATVTCSQSGVLWMMDGNSFRLGMERLSSKNVQRALDFFAKDPAFSKLSESEQKTLALSCSVQVFSRGDQILREGEVGDWMFIVIEGTVQTVDRFGSQALKTPGTLLGSAGLVFNKNQVSGARANENVTCLALGKKSLERLLGPVEDVFRRSATKALLMDQKTQDLAFFKELTERQKNAFIDKFDQASFAKDDTVISLGGKAQLVVISEGEIEVAKADKSKEVLTSGSTFGGYSLVTGTDIDETLVALQPTTLLRISVDMVTEALSAPLSDVLRWNEIKLVLSDIFLFKNLTASQVERVVKSLVLKTFKTGETIVKQGDQASDFFLIRHGVINVSKDGQPLRKLGRWDYFGERALLLDEKRSATCSVEDDCAVLSLEQGVFTDIVGIFRKELEHRMQLQDSNMLISDLKVKAIVGRGSFGVVKMCYHKQDPKKVYALKCVGKKQVVKQGQQKSICVERDINAQCYHPCIMQFIKTFQDDNNVYFLTEFLGGGDLFYTIREIGNLSKTHCQFFGASIALALEYLHARGIMYRDLKPENVLLDFKGNAKLVDMGCCKVARRTNTLVGTPEYFAPETILGKGYTCAIDWWALGVMMHEFVVGPLPFGRDSEDQLELFRDILESPLQFPPYIQDAACINVLSGFLERSPELRLGGSTRGVNEIKEHPYFLGFDWDALAGRYMPAPWVPQQDNLQATWERPAESDTDLGAGLVSDSAKNDPAMQWALCF